MLSRRMLSKEDEASLPTSTGSGASPANQALTSDIPVRAADQAQINRFSRLHARLSRLEGSLATARKQREEVEEVDGELELLELEEPLDDELEEDEDEVMDGDGLASSSGKKSAADKGTKVPFRIGDCFVLLSVGEARAKLEERNRTAGETVGTLEADIEKVREEMDELKTGLYARFGKSINLEG